MTSFEGLKEGKRERPNCGPRFSELLAPGVAGGAEWWRRWDYRRRADEPRSLAAATGGVRKSFGPTAREKHKPVDRIARRKEPMVKKKFAVLLALGVIAGALTVTAPPAHAALVGGVKCHVRLDVWPSPGGSASCQGNVVGVAANPTEVCAVPLCTFQADVAYQEPCPVPGVPLPPVLGFAQGRYSINGSDRGGIDWTRVGVVAVVLPKGSGNSAGVAAFAPTPGQTLGQCSPGVPLPLEADIVAAAVGL